MSICYIKHYYPTHQQRTHLRTLTHLNLFKFQHKTQNPKHKTQNTEHQIERSSLPRSFGEIPRALPDHDSSGAGQRFGTPNTTCPERSRREHQTFALSEAEVPNIHTERSRSAKQRTTNKLIILRHDVDLLPQNSLRFAQIQHDFGISGSYYFRAVPESWDEKIIKEIHQLGHEVGYHYESLTTCNGDMEVAYADFTKNLERLRNLVPVATICMHGSPRSPYDSKDLWKHYDYHTLGIIGEPYFDLTFGTKFTSSNTPNAEKQGISDSVAFSSIPHRRSGQQTPNTERQTPNNKHQTLALSAVEVPNTKPGTKNNEQKTTNNFFYLTDTGRRWDGWRVSVRDKVPQQDNWIGEGLVFRSTRDIIRAAIQNRLPDQIMMTFHPQRWSDKPLPWLNELLWQGVKNVGKRILIQIKKG
jgi:hypothetical protein